MTRRRINTLIGFMCKKENQETSFQRTFCHRQWKWGKGQKESKAELDETSCQIFCLRTDATLNNHRGSHNWKEIFTHYLFQYSKLRYKQHLEKKKLHRTGNVPPNKLKNNNYIHNHRKSSASFLRSQQLFQSRLLLCCQPRWKFDIELDSQIPSLSWVLRNWHALLWNNLLISGMDYAVYGYVEGAPIKRC